MRSLGASPAMTVADGLLGVVLAIVAGSVLAVMVAVALSPLAPLGPVHAVYPIPASPSTGRYSVAVWPCRSSVSGPSPWCWPSGPHPAVCPRTASCSGGRPSALATSAASSGLPLSAVTGIQSPSNRAPAATPCRCARHARHGPRRPGAHRHRDLRDQPRLPRLPPPHPLRLELGLLPSSRPTERVPPLPRPRPCWTATATSRTASSGVDFRTVDLDNQTVGPALPRDRRRPLRTSDPVWACRRRPRPGGSGPGHHGPAPQGGSATPCTPSPRASATLTIVGTTTLPAVGISQGLHTSMGTGAYAATGTLSNSAPPGRLQWSHHDPRPAAPDVSDGQAGPPSSESPTAPTGRSTPSGPPVPAPGSSSRWSAPSSRRPSGLPVHGGHAGLAGCRVWPPGRWWRSVSP